MTVTTTPTQCPANCEPRGTVVARCTGPTGNCPCMNNIQGSLCNECMDGFWDFPTCSACGCNSAGTSSCNKANGQCTCSTGFTGVTCDTCSVGYYSSTCQSCNCNSQGSTSTACDLIDGKCNCAAEFTGDKCDRCLDPTKTFPDCGSDGGIQPTIPTTTPQPSYGYGSCQLGNTSACKVTIQNDTENDWMWKAQTGQAPNYPASGPATDFDKDSEYLLLDSTTEGNTGSFTVGPVFSSTRQHKLEFAFYADGNKTSKLLVIKIVFFVGSRKKRQIGEEIIFESSGEPVSRWQQVNQTFREDNEFELNFKVSRQAGPVGETRYGDVAIDHIMLTEEPAVEMTTMMPGMFHQLCTFNFRRGCEILSEPGENVWQRVFILSDPSEIHLYPIDVPEAGGFILANKEIDVAESSFLIGPIQKNGMTTISFDYFIENNPPVSMLNVSLAWLGIESGAEVKRTHNFWSSRQHPQNWTTITQNVDSSAEVFFVQFTAIKPRSPGRVSQGSNIGVDDVNIHPMDRTITPDVIQPGQDVVHRVNCSFQSLNECDMVLLRYTWDPYQWQWEFLASSSPNWPRSGPVRGADDIGGYLVLNGSKDAIMGAFSVGPVHHSSGKYRVKFHYHIDNVTMVRLSVKMIVEGERANGVAVQDFWNSQNVEDDDDWRPVDMIFEHEGKFQVLFTATKLHVNRLSGDVAVDAISIQPDFMSPTTTMTMTMDMRTVSPTSMLPSTVSAQPRTTRIVTAILTTAEIPWETWTPATQRTIAPRTRLPFPQTPPPQTQPRQTQPPQTQPPRTQPRRTQPPQTQPPRTQPPQTQPRQTQPPRTQPPRTQPPRTQPPRTQRPVPVTARPEASTSKAVVRNNALLPLLIFMPFAALALIILLFGLLYVYIKDESDEELEEALADKATIDEYEKMVLSAAAQPRAGSTTYSVPVHGEITPPDGTRASTRLSAKRRSKVNPLNPRSTAKSGDYSRN